MKMPRLLAGTVGLVGCALIAFACGSSGEDSDFGSAGGSSGSLVVNRLELCIDGS